MAIVCPCPGELKPISDQDCANGQYWYAIERLIFQRTTAASILKTSLATGATWINLFGLDDDDPDKAIITPRFSLNLAPTVAEPVEVTTANSREIAQTIARRETRWEGSFFNLTSEQREQIDYLLCLKDVTVWLINNQNQIIGNDFSATHATGFSVFPGTIFRNTLAVGDGGGGTNIALNAFRFTLSDKTWDTKLLYTDTDFVTTITA